MAFDQYKSLLSDENGNISGPGTVIAGFGAGITESLLAVTPFESIKTTLSVGSIKVILMYHHTNDTLELTTNDQESLAWLASYTALQSCTASEA